METTPLGAQPSFLKWLGVDKASALRLLHDWDLGYLKNKLNINHGYTEDQSEVYILGYKRFMSFKGLRPNIRCGMFSERIDNVWHLHLIYTQDYMNFCDRIFGRFIHHVPCDVMDLSPSAMEEYRVWLADYEGAYGPWPEDLAEELKDNVGPLGPKCTDHDHGGDKYKCN